MPSAVAALPGGGTGSAGAFELYVEQQAALRKLTRTQLLSQKGYGLSHARGKFRQTTQGAVDRVIAQGGHGEFFKLRLTGGLVMLESVLFMFKARELADTGQDEVARVALEFAAASATTAAAALEIGSVVHEWLFKQSSSPAARAMAEIRLGGFKLAGAAMGTAAGAAAAYLDFQAAGKASQEDKMALAYLFGARSFANVLAAGASVALGLSYAGPLLEHWATTTGISAFSRAATAALWLAKNRNLLFAANWISFFAVVSITGVIAIFDDDAMQKWVKRSSFRKLPNAKTPAVAAGAVASPASAADLPKPEPLYKKPGEELAELFNGFAGVTA